MKIKHVFVGKELSVDIETLGSSANLNAIALYSVVAKQFVSGLNSPLTSISKLRIPENPFKNFENISIVSIFNWLQIFYTLKPERSKMWAESIAT